MALSKKGLSIKTKQEIIKTITSGEKQIDVSRRLNLGPSTIATIWKKREPTMAASSRNVQRKRLTKDKYPELEDKLLKMVKPSTDFNCTT